MAMHNNKALSPVIAAIILIAVTIAVSIAIATWMGNLSFTFMRTEELSITSCVWAADSSYADLTVKNTGANTVTMKTVQVDDHPATSVTFVSGNSTVDGGETVVLRVSYDFVLGAKHNFWVITTTGMRFSYMATAPYGSVQFRMEWGTTIVNDTFRVVNLQNNYLNPVVVCTPQYISGAPRTVRLTNVTSQSFSVRVQNPSSGACSNTFVHFLVVEEGVWASPMKLEARKYSTNTVGQNNNWAYDTIDYGQTYSGNIVVLHQVMSYNDPSWITTYVSRMNSRTNPPDYSHEGFRIALNGAEAVDSHANETIGYIILEQGFGDIAGIKYELKRTTDSVRGFGNSPPYNTAFSQNFAQAPAILVSAQLEMDGGDGGWIVTHSISQTQAGLMIDEDQVNDSERSHTTETCGFIAFETGGSYSP